MIQHLSDTLTHIGNTLHAMAQGSSIVKFLIGMGSAVVGFYAPIWYLLCICFATTIIDMIYGFKVARKFKKKIESGKNWKGTIRKLKDSLIILSLVHGLEWAVLEQSGVFLLTGGVATIISLTEIWSIIENLNTLDPKGPWRMLGKFLRKKGEDYTGIDLSDDEDTNDHTVAKEPLEDGR